MEQKLLIVAVSLLIINGIFSYLHIKYYQTTVKKMICKKDGYFAIGISQSKWRSKKIVLLTTDFRGTITECKILSGITVFAHFCDCQKLVGQNYDQVVTGLLDKNFVEPGPLSIK